MAVEQKTIEKIALDLIKHLEIKAGVKVSKGEESSYKVEITGEDLGILIGFHGETLSALQLIISLITYKKLGSWVRILVDVGNYRDERNKKLEEIVEKAVQRARFLQKKVELKPMNSYERRIVHSIVSEMKGASSESEGEGRDRHVIIVPEKEE